MDDQFQDLIDGYLDDSLSREQWLRLNAWLKVSPSHAERFARAMLLHDRLYTELRAEPVEAAPIKTLTLRQRFPIMPWSVTIGSIAALLLVALFFWQEQTVSSASAASAALDRMIEAAQESVDRVYRIHVIDYGPAGPAPQVQAGGGGRKPGIDGAELSVRGSDRFVLRRFFGNGTEFLTGSDGKIGWAVAPKGAVHLSRDTRRFRRAVPGEHEEVPFLDLRADFDELRRGYDLQLAAVEAGDAQARQWQRLIAVRRGRHRGPERVEVWFDDRGVAHRIELVGLPPEEQSPRSVVLELIEQRDLGPDFFSHESHHDADRPIDWE
ncbi:MAG TPA: hypothetical protein VG713_13830 [Pirellulales bacterium]|nr:hypothetical protein [Pirellulales bacterium]